MLDFRRPFGLIMGMAGGHDSGGAPPVPPDALIDDEGEVLVDDNGEIIVDEE